MRKDWIMVALSLTCLVGLWAVAAAIKNDALILPTPLHVAQVWAALWQSGELWTHLSATLIRVIIAFSLAMGLGSVIGIALGRRPHWDRFFGPWVTVFLNIPALVVIVLCYLWIGLNETAAIAAVTLNKIAQVIVTLRDGTRATDPAYDDMAHVFAMPAPARWRHVLIPQLAPFFAVARKGVLQFMEPR